MAFSKDPNTARVPASLTKLMTAVVARQWVNDASLDTAVTVTVDDDPAGPGAGGVALGDIVTYRDLFYLMMMTSRDDATHCLARNVGQLIIDGTGTGSTDPYTRFVEEMNNQAAILGATESIFYDTGGSDINNRMSVTDVEMLMTIISEDAFVTLAAGTMEYTVTTLNGSPRIFNAVNLFDPTGLTQPDPRVVTGFAFPEHVANKYGILAESGYCMAIIWDMPNGTRRITTVMGAADDTELKKDLRTLMNYEIALAGDLP